MPGKDAYCCVFMENLALHQRSLLLMVDVWRPACTWHRLHRTLFWVLIRQACSENHLTAHYDCSQMLQKMASPLRLTATAVILSNVKQEATLSDAKNVYEVLGVYKKSGSKELFWVRKEMKGYFCLSQRTSERRLPSLQTQIWWRRVCLLSPCAHCWGCSALLTCTNAAYIKEISPPCMLACAACTAVSVCMHRSRVWGAEPALTAARRLFTASVCLPLVVCDT